MMASPRKQATHPATADAVMPAATWAVADRGEEDLPIVLAMADLVADANGEVVLFNDSGLRAVALATASRVAEEGRVGRHVTAAGEDVSGFRFMRFEDGIKLYFQPELDVILVKELVGS